MGYEREEDYKDIDVEMLRIVVETAQKRYISIAEGRMLYSLGVHTFEKLAKDSGARRVIGGRVLEMCRF